MVPGIQTLDEFKQKFPGQLSDRDLPIGKFQRKSDTNKYYIDNTARKSIRYDLQKIHKENDTRSNMFRDSLSSYRFIDTQVIKNLREK